MPRRLQSTERLEATERLQGTEPLQTGSVTRRLQEFEAARPLLEGIAYRMLGSLAEAQDVVQETWLRWRDADIDAIQEPRAWLATVCTRLATNALKSARMRREHYTGTWLPEPWAATDESAPARAEIDESVSFALLVVLETLSPLERAAFLLHDVFDYAFEEIGAILDRSPAACRKLASRARAGIRQRRPRYSVETPAHRQTIELFARALRVGDIAGLARCLADTARLEADGGGKAEAVSLMMGGQTIARFLGTIFKEYANSGKRVEVAVSWFNGARGALVREDGVITTAIQFEVVDGQIVHILAQRNPDKLGNAGLDRLFH